MFDIQSTPLSSGMFFSVLVSWESLSTPGERAAFIAQLAAAVDAAADEAQAEREARVRLQRVQVAAA